MRKLPTRLAEKIYCVLMRFAEARPDYYSREEFIFHFGVTSDTSDRFNLSCMDEAKRTFVCKRDGTMWLEGKGAARVNSILIKIKEDFEKEYNYREFTIKQNENPEANFF